MPTLEPASEPTRPFTIRAKPIRKTTSALDQPPMPPKRWATRNVALTAPRLTTTSASSQEADSSPPRKLRSRLRRPKRTSRRSRRGTRSAAITGHQLAAAGPQPPDRRPERQRPCRLARQQRPRRAGSRVDPQRSGRGRGERQPGEEGAETPPQQRQRQPPAREQPRGARP